MKWIELNGKKDPPFNKLLLIVINEEWKVATLSEISMTGEGKIYEFEFGFDQSTTTEATHYFIPEPPKNNQ